MGGANVTEVNMVIVPGMPVWKCDNKMHIGITGHSLHVEVREVPCLFLCN